MEYTEHITPCGQLELPATHEATHEATQFMYQPDDFYFNQHRVSQKLQYNRLRKMQIEAQRYMEKQELMQKRRKRQKQIYEYTLKRDNYAREQKEANLRSNSLQLRQKERDEATKQKQRANKLQANETMINLCRKRVEDKKNEYIFRIHSKTKEKQERAHVRKQIMQALSNQWSNQIHFEEWRQHQAKIHKKYQGKSIQPDRLYQEYKQKNILMQALLKAKDHNNTQEMDKNNKKQVKQTQNQGGSKIVDYTRNGQTQPISSSVKENHLRSQVDSAKNIQKKVNKKVQYFGVHEQDMVKQTHKDMMRMRAYIEDHTTMADPTQDPELVQKFQQFLLREILHCQ